MGFFYSETVFNADGTGTITSFDEELIKLNFEYRAIGNRLVIIEGGDGP